MKNLLLFLVGLFLSGSLFSQNKDEMAIKQVIENQEKYWLQCDYDNWADQWWHETYSNWSTIMPNEHIEKYGWEEMSEWGKKLISPENCTSRNLADYTSYDYVIKKNMAYVSLLAVIDNSEIPGKINCVLEKKNSKWKLIYKEWIGDGFFQLENNKAKLNKFAGNWVMDLGSLSYTPDPKGWGFTDIFMSCDLNPEGLKLNWHNKWTNLSGDYEYKGSTQVVSVFGKKDFVAFGTGVNSFNWSHADLGKAVFEEDNKLVIMFYDGGNPDKIVQKNILHKMDGNTLHVTWKGLDDKGETTWKRKFTMHKSMLEKMNEF